jgi:hypothetical protein
MGETTNARGVKLKKTGEMMIIDAELTLAELDAHDASIPASRGP